MVCHPQARYRDVELLLLASSKQQLNVVLFYQHSWDAMERFGNFGMHSIKTMECTFIKNPKCINGCHLCLT